MSRLSLKALYKKVSLAASKSSHVETLLLVAILLVSFFLRTYGLNWDQNQHLHPDERFLTMVATAARIPASMSEYLDPDVSTLNPYNLNFTFYVYGVLPVTVTKLVAVASGLDSYDGIVLVGRLMSALVDVGTLLCVYAIARLWARHEGDALRMKRGRFAFPYLAAAAYGLMVLPIQNAHFFTVDSMMVFFAMTSVYILMRLRYQSRGIAIWMLGALGGGMFFGFSIASKVSTVYVLPLCVMLIISVAMCKEIGLRGSLIKMGTMFVMFCIGAYLALRIGDPHVFASAAPWDFRLNRQFAANIEELRVLTMRDARTPPAIQWINKPSLVFPLINMVNWGMGMILAIVACVGAMLLASRRALIPRLLLLWVVGFFMYQGSRPVMAMRYFYILYPILALCAGYALSMLRGCRLVVALLLVAVWPAMFLSIYSRDHTRVEASAWIYNNIPYGSELLVEHWDDALPLSFPDGRASTLYAIHQIPVFNPDSYSKTREIEKAFEEADYYIASSNRGYGSMMAVPDLYPYMSTFYSDLFSGNTTYKLVAEFTSYPSMLGFVISDQGAEESFSVYDHPRVLIFMNTEVK